MNVTIDDSHPQIDYHGNWSIWRPPNMDSGTPLYFRGTFTSVWNPNHWMNFTFNGTSASVYGTKWLNHGAYSVSVDGGEEETFEGYTPDRRYNQLIYQTGPLDMGQHELRMYNRPNSTTILEPDPTKNDGRLWLDVDYIVVGLPIPAGANVTTTVIDDSHPSITYSREWSPRPNSDSGYYNVTAHQTNTANSGFTMPFTGSSVQLFGTIGPDVGNFSCTVDGVPYVRELNGTWYEKRTNSPLFFLSGLEDGPHTLNLVNLGRGPDKSTFEFDYAVVNSTAPRQQGSDTAPDGSVDNPTGVAGRPSGGSGSALGSGTGSSRTNVGAIAGGVIGGLAAIALLVLLFLCWRRRKRDSTSGDNASASSIEKSPHSPVQQVRVGSRAPGLSGNEVRPFVSDLATSPTLSSSFGTGTATGMAGAGSSVRTGNASTLTYPTEKRGFDRGPGTGAGPSDTSSSAYSPVSDTHHPFQAFHGYRPTPPQPRLSTIADSAHLQLGEPLGRHNTGSTGYLSTNTAEHLGTGSEMDQAHDSDGVQAGEEGSGSGRRSDGQGSSSAGNTNYHTAHSDVQSVQGAPPPDYYTAAASGGSRMQGPVVPRR